jgi:hypothetical protein
MKHGLQKEELLSIRAYPCPSVAHSFPQNFDTPLARR